MSHLQLMQTAAPIFNSNPEGGVYLVTSSIAVNKYPSIHPDLRETKERADLSVHQGSTQSGSSMAYSVTKAAGLHLMKSLAATQGPKIRVNAILPGQLLTDWVRLYLYYFPFVDTTDPAESELVNILCLFFVYDADDD